MIEIKPLFSNENLKVLQSITIHDLNKELGILKAGNRLLKNELNFT